MFLHKFSKETLAWMLHKPIIYFLVNVLFPPMSIAVPDHRHQNADLEILILNIKKLEYNY